MPVKRIPLIGSLTNRDNDPATYSAYDQRFVNCFPQIMRNAVTGSGAAKLHKRQGFGSATTGPANSVSGVIVWSGASNQVPTFCFLSGNNLSVYDVFDITIGGGVIANIRSVSTGPCAVLSETLISGTPYIVVMARKSTDDAYHAWFASEYGTWTEIVDADFVPNINLGTVTGAISGLTLTTTVSSTGINLPVGTVIGGNGVTYGTKITAIGTAVAGVGTYTVSISNAVSSGTIYAYSNWLVGNMVHLDGYAFVMDKNANIWNSDLNTLSSWTSTGFINASSYPDGGVGLARSKDYIVAFQIGSIDFYRNAGNATGSPLSRVQGASVRLGAAITKNYATKTETIKSVNDDVFFIGNAVDSGTRGVYKITGAQVSKVSNSHIDKVLNAAGFDFNYGFAGVCQFSGMQHLVLTSNDSAIDSFAYCIETGVWWIFAIANASLSAVAGFSGITYATLAGSTTIIKAQPGATYSDTTGALTAVVQTQSIDHGTRKRKFYKSIDMVGDKRAVSGNTAISYSDDDYVTFSTARNVDMSTIRPRLTRLGSGQRRAWKFTDAVNDAWSVEAIDVEYEVAAT